MIQKKKIIVFVYVLELDHYYLMKMLNFGKWIKKKILFIQIIIIVTKMK